MSLNLSDDLREALHAEGTPLKLVDSSTGETFVVIPEATFTRAQALLDEDAALAKARIPNAELVEFATKHSPPREWFEGNEEDVS